MAKSGGIQSGKTRKRKSILKKRLQIMNELQYYINSLSAKEFEEMLQNYTSEQKYYIKQIFKPTKKQIKEMLKNL